MMGVYFRRDDPMAFTLRRANVVENVADMLFMSSEHDGVMIIHREYAYYRLSDIGTV
jgi:hypothetical protein